MRSCVIVPCYNEEGRIPVGEFREFLFQHNDVDLLFVNDGSTDGTKTLLALVQKEFPSLVEVLSLDRNVGKAEAVRLGMWHALQKGGYAQVAYFDADLATPLRQFFLLQVALEKTGAQMAFGSRVKRLGVQVDRNALRHYVGRIFATEASILLGLPVYDTQCGAKLFSIDLAVDLFKAPFLSRWFFDIEIFFRLKCCCKGGFVGTSAIEVPLECWVEKGASKVKWTDFVTAPFELFRIYLSYRGKK